MLRALPCSTSEGLRRNCIYAASGIVTPTNDNGEWRIKYNDELYTLYKDSDIITCIHCIKTVT